jgi:outer membrane protein
MMIRIKKSACFTGIVSALTIAFMLSFGCADAYAASSQIGYVDLQRAILAVNEGKRAKAKLQKTFEKKSKKLRQDEEKLLKLRDELKAQLAGQSPEALRDPKMRARAMEFEKKKAQVQQALMKERQELQALEQKALLKITEKMRKIIRKIGKAGKYSLILESQDARMLYAKPHLDLTNEVIRKYNISHK